MIRLCLVFLAALVCSESVRETETWVPARTTQPVPMTTWGGDPEASGDVPSSSDFALYDDEDAGEEEEEELSGSGDGASSASPAAEAPPTEQVDVNEIPGPDRPRRPSDRKGEELHGQNDIPPLRGGAEPADEMPSNVLMAHAGDDGVFTRTEVLAALIAGGAVALMLAVLLVLLLVYRMKKKDEGSYDLGRRPIYRKAPTTEIYA